jgi:hypothetical protein
LEFTAMQLASRFAPALLLTLLLSATAHAGQAPIAKAGDDKTVAAGAECTAIVVLDGSASTDPDHDSLTFSWTGPFGEDGALQTIVGVKATATLGLGAYEFILTATDATGLAATDSVTITVADETAPVLVLTASPTQLWPPNHKMVPVSLTATATDNCGEALSQQPKIVSVTSNEDDNGQGDDNTTGDWEITGELTLNLRAERSGKGSGRIYTITIEAIDAAGNVGTGTVLVKVPHDQGKGDDDDDDDDDGMEDGDYRTHTQADWGGEHADAVEYLKEKFATAFPNGLKIGAGPSGLSGNSATFTTPEAIIAFLPATGEAAPLAVEYIDPTETTGGELAGEAVALTLNIEFDARDKYFGKSKTLLKDLIVTDEADPAFGKTVYELLQMANAYLGGATTLLDGPALTAALKKINESYQVGEECDRYAKPSGCALTEDDCDGYRKALKDKSGKLYDKLKKLFDRDDDGDVKGKEKQKLSKSVREFKQLQKNKDKKAKKEKKGKK